MLRRLVPNLRAVGVLVIFDRGHERLITLGLAADPRFRSHGAGLRSGKSGRLKVAIVAVALTTMMMSTANTLGEFSITTIFRALPRGKTNTCKKGRKND